MSPKARHPVEGSAVGNVRYEPGPPKRSNLESAVDRAVSRAAVELAAGHEVAELKSWLVDLRRSLVDAINGRPPALTPVPPGVPVDDILQLVRQEFLRDMQERVSLSPWDGIRGLSAIARVQALYDRAATAEQTERKTIEDALAPAIEVAHDMRSPMSAVLFLIATLRSGRSGPVTKVQEQQLRLIHSSVLGLNQLVCDLIDYFRGTERFADDGEIAFSISGLLNDVSDIVQPMAEEKGISVEHLTAHHDIRRGRPSFISRVLLNLTSNAIRYAGRGAVLISARDAGPGRVRFAVCDSGRTIPKELLPHLFEAFRPVAKRSDKAFSSSGLGLAICHRLVASLAGELKVESSADLGSRFEFEIDLPEA